MRQCRNRRSAADFVPHPVGADAHIGALFRYSPECRFYSNTVTVPSATYFFCCARKSRQKEALGDALYCALTRAILWPLRGLNALFGHRIAIFPTAYSSDECTTHSCGQTVSTSVLLISGILGRLRFCTIGVYVDGLPFPQQRVLPSPCAATATDGSVVTTQAAL